MSEITAITAKHAEGKTDSVQPLADAASGANQKFQDEHFFGAPNTALKDCPVVTHRKGADRFVAKGTSIAELIKEHGIVSYMPEPKNPWWIETEPKLQRMDRPDLPPERVWGAADSFSEEQRKDKVCKALDDQLNSLIMSKESLDAIKRLDSAIASGDSTAMSDLVKSLADKPQQLKAYVAELQKNLKAIGSDINATVSEGSLVLYRNGDSVAAEFRKDGAAGVRKLSTSPDGTVNLVPGEVLNKSAQEVMKNLSDSFFAPFIHDSKTLYDSRIENPGPLYMSDIRTILK
jgi:hypothetical protein